MEQFNLFLFISFSQCDTMCLQLCTSNSASSFNVPNYRKELFIVDNIAGLYIKMYT